MNDLVVTPSYPIKARVPEGRRIYAIGDIHGRLDLLDALIDIIRKDNAARRAAKATLIFLGDYIDRGPDSRGVIDRLINGMPREFESHFLKGNHEDFLLMFLRDPASGFHWLLNGGGATLLSYGVKPQIVEAAFSMDWLSVEKSAREFRNQLPKKHFGFLRKLNLAIRYRDYFFVHAGVRPGVAFEEQSVDDLLWIREDFLDWTGDYGAVIVHGHTSFADPQNLPQRIGVDTMAWRTGRLSCVGLEGASRWFLST